jgi:hypothetical protein
VLVISTHRFTLALLFSFKNSYFSKFMCARVPTVFTRTHINIIHSCKRKTNYWSRNVVRMIVEIEERMKERSIAVHEIYFLAGIKYDKLITKNIS